MVPNLISKNACNKRYCKVTQRTKRHLYVPNLLKHQCFFKVLCKYFVFKTMSEVLLLSILKKKQCSVPEKEISKTVSKFGS